MKTRFMVEVEHGGGADIAAVEHALNGLMETAFSTPGVLEEVQVEGFRAFEAAGILYVVALGGPLDGVSLWGPFMTREEAEVWAERESRRGDPVAWAVTQLEPAE